ncbi:hypothetical protein AAGG74_17165 [Bacillus mexicanus]|uniref:hypothetical protein n=1 Tax=Bacillus mexicanus TaxID=2834415 RepID=UPI003D1DF827
MKDPNDIMEETLATFAVLIEDHFDIDAYKIDWDSNTKEFSKNDQIKFGMVMIEFHFLYKVEIDYEAETEFEKFPTLKHAWNHVVNKVFKKEGFDPQTLEPT